MIKGKRTILSSCLLLRTAAKGIVAPHAAGANEQEAKERPPARFNQ